ncbi:MAG TPA: hypothetical protein VGH42_14185 [Verrucomicrobiae bacterium]|jgi:uncharacterized BrkB/YihY/UPF0761 family membrane protein
MKTYLYLFIMFLTMAVVEFCVLLRCQRRRSLAACIISGAVFGGIFWTVFSWVCSYAAVRADIDAMKEPTLTFSDYLMYAFFFLMWVLICSAVALVPAGLTAVIYRRFRSQT